LMFAVTSAGVLEHVGAAGLTQVLKVGPHRGF
jgi:hypothetical protein